MGGRELSGGERTRRGIEWRGKNAAGNWGGGRVGGIELRGGESRRRGIKRRAENAEGRERGWKLRGGERGRRRDWRL